MEGDDIPQPPQFRTLIVRLNTIVSVVVVGCCVTYRGTLCLFVYSLFLSFFLPHLCPSPMFLGVIRFAAQLFTYLEERMLQSPWWDLKMSDD